MTYTKSGQHFIRLVLLLLFFGAELLQSEAVFAAELVKKDVFTARAAALNTTSDFHSSAFSIGLKRRLLKNYLFSIEPSFDTGEAVGQHFSFQQISLGLERRVSAVKLFAHIAYEKRTIDQRSDSTNGFGTIGAEWKRSDSNVIAEGGSRGFAQELQSLASVRDNLMGTFYSLRYNVYVAQKLRLSALTKTYFISDSNRRTDSDIGLMYGISPSWPWIWVGVGAEYLTNSIPNTNGYWSPRQFVNVGPRLDLAVPVGEKLSFSMGLNLNKYNDVDFGDGTGFYTLAKMTYGNQESTRFEVGYEGISSEQTSNKWTSSSAFVGVQCPF